MPIPALYDIHGNLPALEAVLPEVREAGVDHIVIGGDVLPGPMPRECLALLQGLDIPFQCIRGSGESAVLVERAGGEPQVPEEAREAIRWTAEQLNEDLEEWISRWPLTVRLEAPGLGPVLFCHATPRNDTDIFTKRTPESALLPIFGALDVELWSAAIPTCNSIGGWEPPASSTPAVWACPSAGREPTGCSSVKGWSYGIPHTIWRPPRTEYGKRTILRQKPSP